MLAHNDLINPKKIHIFAVVAETRNITHAAQKLHLSQPAISNSLATLEEFFTAKLYEVKGREIIITHAGKMLLKHWSCIESCYQTMHDELRAIKAGDEGEINLAMVSTAKYFVPSLIKNFAVTFPKVQFDCQIINRNQIIERLLNQQTSLGLLTEPPHHHDLLNIKLGANPLVFICHPNHRLARKRKVSFDDLAKEDFITREHAAQITQNLYKLFERHKREPNITLTINSTEAIKEAVIENIGIALMPCLAVYRDVSAKKIATIKFDTKTLTNNWYVTCVKQRTMDAATKAFVSLMKNAFKDNNLANCSL